MGGEDAEVVVDFAGVLLVLGVLAVALGAVDGVAREVCAGLDGVRAFDGTGFDGAGVPLVSGSGLDGTGSGGISGTSYFGSDVPFVVGSAAADGRSVVTGKGSGCGTGDLKRNEEGGGTDGVVVASTTDFGGHSRFSLTSSLAESPVVCETTLELLGES